MHAKLHQKVLDPLKKGNKGLREPLVKTAQGTYVCYNVTYTKLHR